MLGLVDHLVNPRPLPAPVGWALYHITRFLIENGPRKGSNTDRPANQFNLVGINHR